MRKCSFCIQRIDLGKKPACVAKCTTGALAYFPEAQLDGTKTAYGKKERLQMVYDIEGKPQDYALPDPVPLNTVTSSQIWNWLTGLIPGGLILAWVWKKMEDEETDHA
jgi:hypothetical protein